MIQLACQWNLAHGPVACVAPTLIQEVGPAGPDDRGQARRAGRAARRAAAQRRRRGRDPRARRQHRRDGAQGREPRALRRRAARPLGAWTRTWSRSPSAGGSSPTATSPSGCRRELRAAPLTGGVRLRRRPLRGHRAVRARPTATARAASGAPAPGRRPTPRVTAPRRSGILPARIASAHGPRRTAPRSSSAATAARRCSAAGVAGADRGARSGRSTAIPGIRPSAPPVHRLRRRLGAPDGLRATELPRHARSEQLARPSVGRPSVAFGRRQSRSAQHPLAADRQVRDAHRGGTLSHIP